MLKNSQETQSLKSRRSSYQSSEGEGKNWHWRDQKILGLHLHEYVKTHEEEEEGTGIASDVVKVQGEDPATPGLLP